MDRKGNGAYLAAYYESAAGELPVAELREYVGEQLPSYMIPSYFVRMEALPLTPSGKVDRRSLPVPDGPAAYSLRETVPRSEAERALMGLWTEILGLSEVGRDDNFFELGGHSLHAAQLMERIRREGHTDLTLTDFFRYPTIAALAKQLSGTTAPDDRVAAAEERAGERKALMLKQREARSRSRR